MIYLIDLTWLILLAPGLGMALWGCRRLAVARRLAGRADEPTAPTGSDLASALLRAQGLQGWEIFAADGPLWDLADPPRRTLRLGPRTVAARSGAALGRAGLVAGQALQHEVRSPLARLARPLLFATRLGTLAAWMTMAAGVGLEYYGLFLAGIVLFDGVVLLGLLSWPVGRDAARRAAAALGRLGEIEPDLRRRIGLAMDAAPWHQVAAAVFRP